MRQRHTQTKTHIFILSLSLQWELINSNLRYGKLRTCNYRENFETHSGAIKSGLRKCFEYFITSIPVAGLFVVDIPFAGNIIKLVQITGTTNVYTDDWKYAHVSVVVWVKRQRTRKMQHTKSRCQNSNMLHTLTHNFLIYFNVAVIFQRRYLVSFPCVRMCISFSFK